jgi:hypothetical protein
MGLHVLGKNIVLAPPCSHPSSHDMNKKRTILRKNSLKERFWKKDFEKGRLLICVTTSTMCGRGTSFYPTRPGGPVICPGIPQIEIKKKTHPYQLILFIVTITGWRCSWKQIFEALDPSLLSICSDLVLGCDLWCNWQGEIWCLSEGNRHGIRWDCDWLI